MTSAVAHRLVAADALDRMKEAATQGDPAKVIESCRQLQKAISELACFEKDQSRSFLDQCHNEIIAMIGSLQTSRQFNPRKVELQRQAQLAYGVQRRAT